MKTTLDEMFAFVTIADVGSGTRAKLRKEDCRPDGFGRRSNRRPFECEADDQGVRTVASNCVVRGRPINTGWKTTAPISVETSDSASNAPRLDVPGWCENHRLPNAAPVVAALKITA